MNDSVPQIYLDNAATSFPKPDCVYDAVDSYMRRNGASVGRSSHAAAQAGSRMVEQCRQRISSILDAESSDRVAFTFNCTDGLNLLLRGILRRGDRVVTTKLEHNSVLRPLADLASEADIDVVHIGFDPKTGMVDAGEIVSALCSAPTQLVVLNHASNVTGVVQPVAEIASAARAHGALLLLDAAQTVGHVPFSVRDLGIDLLAAAGHKGLLGTLGTGILYVRKGLEDRIRSLRSGGTGTSSESVRQPTTMPTKFESGNMNALGLAGLNAAAKWLTDQGIQTLHQQSQQYVADFVSGVAATPGVRLFAGNERSENIGIVSIAIEGLDSREAATILEQSFGIQCRAGLHCAPMAHEQLGTEVFGGTVRFSVGPFTTAEHIRHAVNAVAEVAAAIHG